MNASLDNGREPSEEKASKTDLVSELLDADLLLGLYLWLFCVLGCGLANLGDKSFISGSRFIILGVSSLTFLSALCLKFPLSPSSKNKFLNLISIILGTLPLLQFEAVGVNDVILIDLYFISILSIPAFFKLWAWKSQCLASFVCLASMFWMQRDLGLLNLSKSLILVGSAALLSGAVIFLRRNRTSSMSSSATRYLTSRFSGTKPLEMRNSFWSVSLAQAGLIIALIFFEGDFIQKEVAIGSALFFKVYALVGLIFGNLLLGVVKTRNISKTIVITELVVSLVLLTSLVFSRNSGMLYGALPAVFLAYTTLSLGWSLTHQVFFCWFMILVSVFSRIFVGSDFGSAVELGLSIYNSQGELSLIVVGLTSSVFVFRAARRAGFDHLSEISGTNIEGSVRLKEISSREIFTKLRTGLEFESISVMVKTLLGLLFVSCFLSTILVVSSNSNLWGLAGLTWVCAVFSWSLLAFYSGKEPRPEQQKLWFFGSLLAIVLILWPTILLVYDSHNFQLWFLWVLFPLIGIGMIPWRIQEMLPLVAVTIFSAIEVTQKVGTSSEKILYFAAAGLISVAASQYRGQKQRQNYLIRNLPHSLSACSTPRELYIVIADIMLGYFQTRDALISESEDSLVLFRGETGYVLEPEQWPLRALLKREKPRVFEDSGVQFFIMNWLPSGLEFFHQGFGVFSASHGLALSFLEEERIISAVEPESQIDKQAVIFIPFRQPIFDWLKTEEINFVKSVTSLALLRAETCKEKNAFQRVISLNEQASSSREYELSALVHDINNTVQDLTVLCETLGDELIAEVSQDTGEKIGRKELLERVSRISVVARSMATVVSDAKRKRELERLRDLSPKELINVNESLSEIAALSAVRAERKRIKIVYQEASESVWVKVSAREHFETILRNLLNNAVIYSDPGGEIRVSVKIEEEWLEVEVSDDGPGLVEGEEEAIFVAGIRGRSGDGVPGGLGIGLSQSRRVAVAAGGSLTATSDGAGCGSSFVLRLPAHSNHSVSSGARKWALMVDDQSSFVEFYSRIARALELEPKVASSFDEAKEIVEENGRPYFVLTDLHLGNSSGFELVHYVRKKFGDLLPILVVSGLPDEDIEQRVRAAGATDFVPKPIGRRALFSRIQSLLSQIELN